MKLFKLRTKNDKELNSELLNLMREKFNLNIQSTRGQLKQTHMLKIVRRNIARIKTLLTEKRASNE